MKELNICVLGDGGWGTTLAIMLFRKGYKVSLWSAFADYAAVLNKQRVNRKFLPGVKIPAEIEISSDLGIAIRKKDLIIIAIPSQYVRRILKKISRLSFPKDAIYLSVSKGIEIVSLRQVSEIVREELGKVKFAVLSGPTIAKEVVCGIPTTAVVASCDKNLGSYLQSIFTTERFRVYTNSDVIGVELGGSLKNVIAIACGISDGLGFGTNTKAAILSRGLAEISRLGVAIGAKEITFSGISGLGDLVTTCISPYSRNRFVGEQIGRGKALRFIRSHMQMVAEGMPTAKAAYLLGLKFKVDLPIITEVYRVLYKNKLPLRAVKDLMTRKRKEE